MKSGEGVEENWKSFGRLAVRMLFVDRSQRVVVIGCRRLRAEELRPEPELAISSTACSTVFKGWIARTAPRI